MTAHPPTYRPPRDCPVCTDRLHVTQLGCRSCGTAVSGAFTACDFCSLDDAARDVLRVFLTSRGNLREVERHLGVSYPTARARFDDLLARLGLAPTPPRAEAPAPPATPEASAGSGDDDLLATLREVAAGRLPVDTARTRLGGDPAP